MSVGNRVEILAHMHTLKNKKAKWWTSVFSIFMDLHVKWTQEMGIKPGQVGQDTLRDTQWTIRLTPTAVCPSHLVLCPIYPHQIYQLYQDNAHCKLLVDFYSFLFESGNQNEQ